MSFTWNYANIYMAILLLAVIVFPLQVYPATSGDVIQENWAPKDTQRRYKNLAEERFNMECDYLGINGGRLKGVRKLFDKMLISRERVNSAHYRGDMTRDEAIELLNRLDLEYYLELEELVRGERNLGRIRRMIVKVKARNGISGKLAAQAN